MNFAKLYEGDFGQVLFVCDTDDDGAPSVKISVMPDGLGVCTATIGFPDTDEGYDKRDAYFDKIDEALGLSIGRSTFNQLSMLATAEDDA